eukprot:gene14199-biopygen8273
MTRRIDEQLTRQRQTWTGAIRHPFGGGPQDINVAYRLRDAFRKSDACNQLRRVLSPQGEMLSGQQVTDFMAHSLNQRGQSIREADPQLWAHQWPQILSKIRAAMPLPSSSIPSIELPSKQHLLHAIKSKFNLKAAYGPDLTHNRHLLVLSDEDFTILYKGLRKHAAGDVYLPQQNCRAYIHLLYKSKNPLYNDRWRALVIFGHKYKLVEFLDFEAVRPHVERQLDLSIQGFVQGHSSRTATDSTHADIDYCRMQRLPRIFLSMDLVQAFPRLLREIVLAIYTQIRLPDWWVRARMKLWGALSWDIEKGEL